MQLDDFVSLLSDAGIGSKESGVSLAVEFCPACNRQNYKVIFRVRNVDEDEAFFGRCQAGSCQQGYSSVSYLVKIGLSRQAAMTAHGLDGQEALKQITLDGGLEVVETRTKLVKPAEKVFVDTDVSKFFDIANFPKHPAAKYAVKRGFVENHKDIMKIDTKIGAVVFICKDLSGKVLGFQRRYITVPEETPKTKMSEGFDRNSIVLRFARNDVPVVICEGPFTALSAWHYGFDGICTFGSNVSEGQYALLKRICGDREVMVARENDGAGIKYHTKIANNFHWLKKEVKVILPEVGSDLNDSWVAGKSFSVVEEYINPAVPNVFSF